MKILVNTRFLLKNNLEGIGRFTYESLKRITMNHPEHKFIFLFDRQWDESFIFSKNVTPIKINPPARHPFLWYLWFHFSVPQVIKTFKPDIFLSTDGFTSVKGNCKKITVFHDLAFEHFPGDVGGLVLKYYKKFTPKYVKASDRIATVSSYSKEDLVKTYGVPESKIDVVYNGSSSYFKLATEENNNIAKIRFSEGKNYFCFVGALQPRKNIVRLFEAFDKFKTENDSDVKLVVVGRKAWKSDEIFSTYENMKFKTDVLFTGHLKHEEIRDVYAASLGLVYVPYFEGFGIPIIEAQNCGCPVITSNVTSMPEVGGEGAILVDPFDVSEIAKSMTKLYVDTDFRKELSAKGFESCKRFSWDLTAQKLWDSIEKLF